MAKDKSDAAAVFVANDSFYYGGSQLVMAGNTVEAGHPMLKGREHLFRPFEPTWPKPSKADKPAAAPAAAKPNGLAERRALVERAKELGIPAKGKSDELAAAIAEAEAAAAAAAAASQPNPDADNGETEPVEDQ